MFFEILTISFLLINVFSNLLNVSDISSYKRSRSEDNILQANEEEFDGVDYDNDVYDDTTVTPILIGEAMSRDDPFYEPSISNPFADMAGFREGRKILGKSFGDVDSMMFELPSPSSPTTPPCTPNLMSAASSSRKTSVQLRPKSQSLPSSPVLLRKAAERLHQQSIHGSNSKKPINQNRYSFSAYSTRSKSVFFPEAVAQRLQYEMFDTGSPYNNRSREGSVESDSTYNYMNTYPINRIRRHSNLENSATRRNDTSSSLTSSYVNSRQESIDETGDNEINYSNTDSVYPSLSYASESAKSGCNLLNNNHLHSTPDAKVSFDVTFGDPCSPENEIVDPWSMRRETLRKTAIIEEPVCNSGMMETSV